MRQLFQTGHRDFVLHLLALLPTDLVYSPSVHLVLLRIVSRQGLHAPFNRE
jgi:hypothetical protein